MIDYYICNDCPRNCNTTRYQSTGNGFCKAGSNPKIAKIMSHAWEEPCISGKNGACNIFFAACNLKCCYCQNHKITLDMDYNNSNYQAYTANDLSLLFKSQKDTETHNINLVTADCYLRTIAEAITDDVKRTVKKPFILNCSGYNKTELLESLNGKIDIFLPDFKYSKAEAAKKYSYAPDYPEVAASAIKKMFEITGPCVFDENGMLQKGVVIRHLILPGNLHNTFGVIDWVNENFKSGEVIFSLMSQYTPCGHKNSSEHKELQRKITAYEKRKAEAYLYNTDITLAYVQDETSAEASYIPDF